jgi:hypothetical protein
MAAATPSSSWHQRLAKAADISFFKMQLAALAGVSV